MRGIVTVDIGDRDRGLAFLRTNAERIVRENGLANECYRGDRDEPFDSCFLLGFSIAPFLTTIFERLWGLTVRFHEGTLRVDPAFPSGWTGAALRRLRVGPGWVDLEWTPGAVEVRWSGPTELRVEGRSGSIRLAAGTQGKLGLPSA